MASQGYICHETIHLKQTKKVGIQTVGVRGRPFFSCLSRAYKSVRRGEGVKCRSTLFSKIKNDGYYFRKVIIVLLFYSYVLSWEGGICKTVHFVRSWKWWKNGQPLSRYCKWLHPQISSLYGKSANKTVHGLGYYVAVELMRGSFN